MKKTALLLICFALILLAGQNANAQLNPSPYYKYAAGLKFSGYENGVSGKYFINENNALEAMVGLRSHGLVVTGLYELHQTAFNVAELKFYYGAGGHIGGVGSGIYKKYSSDDKYYNNGSILIGADAVVGLEYLIPESPIALSLDLNPRLEIGRGPFFDLAPGLGIKYAFK